MVNKKAQNQIGIAIIVMALLLLFGGIFLDSSNNSSNTGSNINSNNQNNYLFSLDSTNIGKQQIVSQNYPNIILGSKEEFNTIFVGNNFRLNANPFTSTPYSFDVQLKNKNDANYLLLYFKPKSISGDSNLIILANGKLVSKNKIGNLNIPIRVQNNFNSSKIRFTFLIEKPNWYSLFNWNKFDISQIKIVEVDQNTDNGKRKFDFKIKKDSLERVYLDFLISCTEYKEISDAIKIKVNGYILSNSNPTCNLRNNKITLNVPINILSNFGNTLELSTKGLYKIAYSLNKIYFNEQDTYRFNIRNFNDFNRAIMYGNYDKDALDLILNGQPITLTRRNSVDVFDYLRIGSNELVFLTKPIEVKEFIIDPRFVGKSSYQINVKSNSN